MDAPDCPRCRLLLQRVADLEAQLLAVQGQLRDLADRMKPPPPKPRTELPAAPPKAATGRKPGGQPGHPPHLRTLLPPDRVAAVVAHVPKTCGTCRAPLPAAAGADDPEPTRFQVVELPPLAARVTEHQGHARTCPCCRAVTREPIPADVRGNAFGPRLTAALSYLVGVHGLSKRGVEEVAETLFDAPIALGTVANLEQEVSGALAAGYVEVRDHLAAAPVKNVDETGWTQAGKKRTLWAGVTAVAACFMIHPRRHLAALKQFVGAGLSGVLGSDRAKVYDNWPGGRRQLCWAHLKRNWEKWVERGGEGARLAGEWLELHRLVFELWHLRKAGSAPESFDERMAALAMVATDVLARGRSCANARLARFCRRLSARQAGLWTFLTEPGVEPTNNRAERALRRAVLWRRKSFGCHSEAGCRFVERVLTAVQTLKMQKRSVLAYLQDAVEARRAGRACPGLLPTG